AVAAPTRRCGPGGRVLGPVEPIQLGRSQVEVRPPARDAVELEGAVGDRVRACKRRQVRNLTRIVLRIARICGPAAMSLPGEAIHLATVDRGDLSGTCVS